MNAAQRRKAVRVWMRRILASSFNEVLDRRRITPEVLARLGQYDLSIPTGATPGRVWRSDITTRERYRWQRRRPGWELSTSGPRPVPKSAPPLWVVAEVTNEPHPDGGWRIRWSLAVDDQGCLLRATSPGSAGAPKATDRVGRPKSPGRARDRL